jgi:hypothetical protein
MGLGHGENVLSKRNLPVHSGNPSNYQVCPVLRRLTDEWIFASVALNPTDIAYFYGRQASLPLDEAEGQSNGEHAFIASRR